MQKVTKTCEHGVPLCDWCGPCATLRWAAMTPAARERDQKLWERRLAAKLRAALAAYVRFHERGADGQKISLANRRRKR